VNQNASVVAVVAKNANVLKRQTAENASRARNESS